MKRRLLYRLGVFSFIVITLFLTFNKHSKSGYYNYHSEIWADKAGYYVYLPAVFKFNFNPNNFPDSIDTKTGNGFTFDIENEKVITKYTYGVALMQMPFFLLADYLSEPFNFKSNGFSPIYHWSINIASIFYLIIGLIFLKKYLAIRFDNKTSIITVLSLFFATHLFYYSIDETGMSHVYSFSLFCLFLYFSQVTNFLIKTSFWTSLFLGFLVGLIVLIRPTNVLFLTVFLFLDLNSKLEFFKRLKRIFYLKSLTPLTIGVLVVTFPQLLYWNYISGSFFNYSYANEGFNWLSPKIINSWFSPNNGLFLYTPFYLLVVSILFFMIKDKKINGIYLLSLFLIISYVFSSWWSWDFGCAFGSRSYVEYLSVFSIPLAQLIYEIKNANKTKMISLAILLIIIIAFNLKMTYSYDGCFFGNNTWDWNWYFELVKSSTK